MDLKPCPFCGSDDLTIGWPGTCGAFYAVHCINCGIYGPETSEKSQAGEKKAKEQAKKEWNNQQQNQKLIEALEEIVDTEERNDLSNIDKRGRMLGIAQQALDETDNNE